jgi:calcium channel MID1
MQLSPLQSRLAASVIATCLLIAIYVFLFPSHFALAAELDVRIPIGPILDDATELEIRSGFEGAERRDATYEPDFAPFDRSIIGRAPAGVTGLANNVPQQLNLDPGVTACYVFERASMEGQAVDTGSLELRDLDDGEAPRSLTHGGDRDDADSALRRRQSSLPVYISANTCIQPQPNSTSAGLQAPQLTLYISTSAQNTCPGPGKDPNSQKSLTFTEGAVIYNMTSSTDVYIGISAANSTAGLDGGYNFQVAASNDALFFEYNDQLNSDQLVWVDSDSSSSLLISRNLTDSTDPAVQAQFMNSQPYVMFAQPENDPSIAGVRYSYCGLGNYARIAATKNGQFTQTVSTSITTWGTGGLPKQQFYFDGLNASSTYNGILAINGNSTASGSGVVNGGGTVYRATNFTTKAGESKSLDKGYCTLGTDGDLSWRKLRFHLQSDFLQRGGIRRPEQQCHLPQQGRSGKLLRQQRPDKLRILPKGPGADPM